MKYDIEAVSPEVIPKAKLVFRKTRSKKEVARSFQPDGVVID
jgi:hypothetical protein